MRFPGATILCLLLAGRPAAADGAEGRARALIETYRSPESRARWDLVLGPSSPAGEGAWTVESSRDDYWRVLRRFVRFVPGKDEVSVLLLTLITVPGDSEITSWAAQDCAVQIASLSPRDHADLRRAVRLVSGASLEERREPTGPSGPEPRRWHMGDLRIRVGDVFDGKGDLPPEAWTEKGLIGSSIDGHAKAFLLERLLADVIDKLRYETVGAPPSETVPGFREELATTDGWRRDLRAAFLGWLGGAEDLAALRALGSPTPVAERAILELDLLAAAAKSDEGLAKLLALSDDPDPSLKGWARVALRKNFRSSYLDKLSRDYRGANDWEARREILRESERTDPSGRALLREALKDRSGWIRAMAAGRLEEAKTLLDLAKDKGLRKEADFNGRLLAITYLGGLRMPGRDVGPALLRIALDRWDDVAARRDAAEALGRIGYRAAIPHLAAMVAEPPPREPIYLRDKPPSELWYEHAEDMRFGAARALGFLRAKEGTAALMAILAEGLDSPGMSEGGLASVAGEALARIGDPKALPLLEKAQRADRENRKEWEGRVRLLKAIDRRDAKVILEVSRRGEGLFPSGSFGRCDRYWIRLLADTASLGELKAMAAEVREGRDADLLAAAIAQLDVR